jgi:anti-sigma factor RsiW
MNTLSECEQTLLVQADFDGELDAAQAAALVKHREACAQCQAVEAQLVRARALLRAAPRYASSPALRERLVAAFAEDIRAGEGTRPGRGDIRGGRDDAQLASGGARPGSHDDAQLATDGARPGSRDDAQSASDGARPGGRSSRFDRDELGATSAVSAGRRPLPDARRRPWRWSPGWATAAAVVLASVIFFVAPRPTDIGAQVVNNHLRAMQLDSHLVDVVSTDHHTVKPWFAGKVDFAPPVKQLDSDGYVLKGGRVDVVDARTAAVLVYQAGPHTVEVFIWPARPESRTTFQSQQLNGFNLRHWKEGGFEIWCVSDMGSDELDTFASRWRAAS